MSHVAAQSFLFVVIAHAMSLMGVASIGALSIAAEMDRRTLGFLLATRALKRRDRPRKASSMPGGFLHDACGRFARHDRLERDRRCQWSADPSLLWRDHVDGVPGRGAGDLGIKRRARRSPRRRRDRSLHDGVALHPGHHRNDADPHPDRPPATRFSALIQRVGPGEQSRDVAARCSWAEVRPTRPFTTESPG